jgi:L-fuconolactonase
MAPPIERVVDAHIHLWDPATRAYPWMEGPALDPIRRAYTPAHLRAHTGADAVLVQTVSSAGETRDFLAVADAGHVSGVVGWVDLEAGAEPPDHRKLVGVRHQVEDEPDPRWLLRPAVLKSLRALGSRGLVYDLLVRAPQRAAALAAVRACESVRFVLDHAGKPRIAAGEWEPWAGWLAELAACPNVVCKLSGLVTEAGAEPVDDHAAHVLDTFGAGRVMFGSDWPVCELAGGYPRALAVAEAALAGASPGERSDVLGGTARGVYGI